MASWVVRDVEGVGGYRPLTERYRWLVDASSEMTRYRARL